MNNTTFPELKGSDSEKAMQILDILKSKELSKDQLEAILPSSDKFLSELSGVLKAESEYGHKEYGMFMQNAQRTIDVLANQMKEEPSEAVRLKIIDVLDNLNKEIAEIHKNRENHQFGFKKFLAFLGSIMMIVLVILSAGAIKPGQSNKS